MGCIVINFYTRERTQIFEEVNEPVYSGMPVKEKKPRKRKLPETPESVKDMFRDSLDNERVKEKYKLTPKD